MENAMKRSIVVFSLMAMSGLAFADGFNYSYVQASYGTIDVDNSSIDGDGLGLNGSFGITDNLNAVASYQTADFSSLGDADQWSVGLGVHAPITEMFDIVGAVSYIDLRVNPVGAPSVGDDGFGLYAGIRFAATSLIEVTGGLSYVDLSDSGDNTGFGGGVLFNVTDSIALGISADWDDDTAEYTASGRWYFGK
jgi:hypothetical protein